MKHSPSVRSSVAVLAALVAASFMGCMDFMNMAEPTGRSGTTSVTVRVAGPLGVASARGGHADIDSVTISVAGNDETGTPQNPLAQATLTRSTTGAWVGTVAGLTLDTPLTFTAEARDEDDVVIFRGTHSATLTTAGQSITIRLTAVDDGVANRFPAVTGITISNVSAGVAANVSITLTGGTTEQIGWELSGGTFTPSSGTATMTAGAGTITSSYTAPTVPGWYTARIAITNAQGHRAEVDFQIRVQTSALTADLGPVVQGLTGKRTPAGVRWTATVSAAGTGLKYAWTFTKSDGITGTFSFTDATTNPTILKGYTQTTAGTLSVTVTDANSLTTTASLAVPANLFRDLPLMPQKAALIVNEIDYDQPGSTDTAEFVEILNPGTSPVALSGYRIELVNGTNDKPYETYEATGSLAAGGFLVIADQAVIDADDLPDAATTVALTSAGLQNGPDAVRIVAKTDGRVVDAVHYESAVPGAGEGSPAPADAANAASKSIGRCPNGLDSNDNAADFRTMTPTPGAANTCS